MPSPTKEYEMEQFGSYVPPAPGPGPKPGRTWLTDTANEDTIFKILWEHDFNVKEAVKDMPDTSWPAFRQYKMRRKHFRDRFNFEKKEWQDGNTSPVEKKTHTISNGLASIGVMLVNKNKKAVSAWSKTEDLEPVPKEMRDSINLMCTVLKELRACIADPLMKNGGINIQNIMAQGMDIGDGELKGIIFEEMKAGDVVEGEVIKASEGYKKKISNMTMGERAKARAELQSEDGK